MGWTATAYRDRKDAGEQLARALAPQHKGQDALVLALPRGGVPVAYEMARELDAELDVLVARKLGAPSQPELGVGAVAPGGVRVVDERLTNLLHITRDELDNVEALELAEMERRLRRYRGERAPPRVKGRTVILVDDGVATGATAQAAIMSVRAQIPGRLVFAVPVGPPETIERLGGYVDDIVCLVTPAEFGAVGIWYDRFDQTSDDEVIDLLHRARTGHPAPRREAHR